MEPNRINETLQSSASLNKRLAALEEKCFASSMSPEEKEEFISEMTVIRSGLLCVQKNIIKMCVPEEKQTDYLQTTTAYENNILRDRDYLLNLLKNQDESYDKDALPEDELPPIL